MIGLDLFATKGLEYLLVIGYLLLLVVCRRMVGPPLEQVERRRPMGAPPELQAFKLRDGLLYHRGHAWTLANGDGLVRVGIDDFAQKLLGPVTGVIPPGVGTHLAEGEPGWKVRAGRRSVAVLSPVEGEVERWNADVLRSPELVNKDPYGEGWLMEVRVSNPSVPARNLLSGPLAHAWMDEVAEKLERRFTASSELSRARGSGGVGLAEVIAPDDWRRAVDEFLLTSDVGKPLVDRAGIQVDDSHTTGVRL